MRKMKESFNEEEQQQKKNNNFFIYICLFFAFFFVIIQYVLEQSVFKKAKIARPFWAVLLLVFNFALLIKTDTSIVEKSVLSIGFTTIPCFLNRVIKNAGNSQSSMSITSKQPQLQMAMTSSPPSVAESSSIQSETLGNTSFGRFLWPK